MLRLRRHADAANNRHRAQHGVAGVPGKSVNSPTRLIRRGRGFSRMRDGTCHLVLERWSFFVLHRRTVWRIFVWSGGGAAGRSSPRVRTWLSAGGNGIRTLGPTM